MEFTLFDLIIGLLIAQAFVAGIVFSEDWTWARTWPDRLLSVGKTVIIFIAGIPIGILLLFAWPFWKIGSYFWKNLNFGFIIKHMILRIPFKAIPYTIKRIREIFYTESPRWYQIRKRLNNIIVVWAEANFKPIEG